MRTLRIYSITDLQHYVSSCYIALNGFVIFKIFLNARNSLFHFLDHSHSILPPSF